MKTNFIQITKGQVKQIAAEISKRWKFENHGTYYNCIDTKTGQRSNDGGDKNFAHYYFSNAVECAYLKLISEDYSYFDWQKHGVAETEDRKSYAMCIACEIEKLLCGFTSECREMARERLLTSKTV